MDMYRFVLNDYRCNIKEGLKRAYDGGKFFIYILILVEGSWLGVGANYYCCMIPMLLGLLLSRMYAGVRNKTLFLCPLSKEQRISYYETAYRLRFGMGVLVFLVLAGSQVLAGKVSFSLFIWMTIVDISFLLAANTCCLPVENDRRAMERAGNLPGIYVFWNVAAQVSGIMAMIVLIAAAQDEDKIILNWEWAAIIGIVILHCLLAWNMVRKYYQPMLEQEAEYETAGSGPDIES